MSIPSPVTIEAPAARSVIAFGKHHGLGRSRIYELIQAGVIIARKCGSRTLIFDEDNLKFRLVLPLVKPRQVVNFADGTLILGADAEKGAQSIPEVGAVT
jgi:hypothetical protein